MRRQAGQVRVLGQGMGPLVRDLAEELDADEADFVVLVVGAEGGEGLLQGVGGGLFL